MVPGRPDLAGGYGRQEKWKEEWKGERENTENENKRGGTGRRKKDWFLPAAKLSSFPGLKVGNKLGQN